MRGRAGQRREEEGRSQKEAGMERGGRDGEVVRRERGIDRWGRGEGWDGEMKGGDGRTEEISRWEKKSIEERGVEERRGG